MNAIYRVGFNHIRDACLLMNDRNEWGNFK